jgi:23S rRNA (adenine2030-N6)-methyltransferase
LTEDGSGLFVSAVPVAGLTFTRGRSSPASCWPAEPAERVEAMNYRHAFHAGNFADVFKHAILARIVAHLCEKVQPFRVIDTHAGAGDYDLAGEEAGRTGEWRGGIGRLLAAPHDPELAALLDRYLAAVAACNPDGLRCYPGSPLLALAWMRPQDRLVACELEPGAAAALAAKLKRDRRAKAVAIDGWTALNAFVPPKERRGLVVIDPPYEERSDFERLAGRLAQAWRKWPTGIFAMWYPVKDRGGPDVLAGGLERSGIPKILRCEIQCDVEAEAGQLRACGLVVVNPPWRLADELRLLLPVLARVLSESGPGRWRADWLAGEK